MSQLTIVVGGQAGSEGKGAVCGRLQDINQFDFAVRVGGPNAGHTIMRDGQRFPLRQLPVSAVADESCELIIAAGSEVDFEVLKSEIEMVEAAGYEVRSRLVIDKEATVLLPKHVKAESGIKTGSTFKGIGAARADRALRRAPRVQDYEQMELHSVDTQALIRDVIANGYRVLLEGTQGYVLGSHAGWYPYCSSGNCRAIDMMAAAGIPPMEADVWVVLRTYPIRIAGESGPLENEIEWADIGVDPEITTVTKKVRRVGQWNWEWAEASVAANRTNGRAPSLALTFADYWWPQFSQSDGPLDLDTLDGDVRDRLNDIEHRLRAPIRMLGTGPDTQLLIEKGAP